MIMSILPRRSKPQEREGRKNERTREGCIKVMAGKSILQQEKEIEELQKQLKELALPEFLQELDKWNKERRVPKQEVVGESGALALAAK